MSLTMNMVGGAGVKSGDVVAAISGINHTATLRTLQSPFSAVNQSYFLENAGTLVCQKNGLFNLAFRTRSQFNSSGTNIYTVYEIDINGTSVMSGTVSDRGESFVEKNDVAIMAGDIIDVKTRNRSGSNIHEAVLFVTLA